MPKDPQSGMEEAILEAAERLFLEKGFALTSTTEIAKAVGCNQALIHYYFRTKDRLFEAIFEKKALVFFSGFNSLDEGSLSFEESLKRKIEAHFDMVRANPQLPFLIFNELVTNPGRLEQIKARIGGLVASLYFPLEARLKEEIAAGRIRPISAVDLIIDMVSLNVMFFLGSPALRLIRGLSEAEFQRVADARRRENVELMLRGLRP
jgi:TetR/AcrR family transcriptional regulator